MDICPSLVCAASSGAHWCRAPRLNCHKRKATFLSLRSSEAGLFLGSRLHFVRSERGGPHTAECRVSRVRRKLRMFGEPLAPAHPQKRPRAKTKRSEGGIVFARPDALASLALCESGLGCLLLCLGPLCGCNLRGVFRELWSIKQVTINTQLFFL